jgi:hypothetical protein
LPGLAVPTSELRRSPRKVVRRNLADTGSGSESELTDLEDLVDPTHVKSIKRSSLDSPTRKTLTTRDLVKKTRKAHAVKIETVTETITTQSRSNRRHSSESKIPSDKKPKATKRQKLASSLDIPHPAPEQWETVYGLIKEMRKLEVAPVDTMGCQIAGKDETDPQVC